MTRYKKVIIGMWGTRQAFKSQFDKGFRKLKHFSFYIIKFT